MPPERISMRTIREILRLHFGLGLKKRQIGRSCNLSHSIVVKDLRKAEEAGLSGPLPEGLDDKALQEMFNTADAAAKPCRRPLPPMQEVHCELRRKGVTLQLRVRVVFGIKHRF